MMKFFLEIVLLNVLIFCGALTLEAGLVWRPGEGWVDESGEIAAATSSREQLEIGNRYFEKGDYDNALKAYRSLIRRWPLSFMAPEAQFKIGQCLEKRGAFWDAYRAYNTMLQKYPNSEFFNQALERQMAIGNLYLAGEKRRLLKIPLGADYQKAVEIFEGIVRTAPFSRFAPEAQYKAGLAMENMSRYIEAVAAYNRVLERYPADDIADDAQYQIGYAWLRASQKSDYDQSAAQKALEAFEEFLIRYPTSEKAPQARQHISRLKGLSAESSLNIARFYEKQKNYEAAYIYYNDVIQQMPESEDAKIAQRKIDELRSIVERQRIKQKVPSLSSDFPSSVTGKSREKKR
ncbi:MAG: outer membrane protein assembly factor BamD [Methylacidiphilales bacterium]|nr:outer membrane protein assembly factor BamD [Candidatus Methylacidiphilales bacterium]MDW8348855.1 outer membrane protein assembly factor BamD [Verrucomicrobiae bacterium]